MTTIAARSGYSIESVRNDDDSIDCTIKSRTQGKARLEVQLKATYQVSDTRQTQVDFPFEVKRKNYDDLRIPMSDLIIPRLLVVLLMPQQTPDWLNHGNYHMVLRNSAYFYKLQGMPPITTATKTIRIPWNQEFTCSSLDTMMQHIAVYKDLP